MVSRFDNEEIFKQHSGVDRQIIYIGHRDKPMEERKANFFRECQEGYIEIAFLSTGYCLPLVLCSNTIPLCNNRHTHRPSNQSVIFDIDNNKVFLTSRMILDGLPVLWKGWINLLTLEGMGHLELDDVFQRAPETIATTSHNNNDNNNNDNHNGKQFGKTQQNLTQTHSTLSHQSEPCPQSSHISAAKQYSMSCYQDYKPGGEEHVNARENESFSDLSFSCIDSFGNSVRHHLGPNSPNTSVIVSPNSTLSNNYQTPTFSCTMDHDSSLNSSTNVEENTTKSISDRSSVCLSQKDFQGSKDTGQNELSIPHNEYLSNPHLSNYIMLMQAYYSKYMMSLRASTPTINNLRDDSLAEVKKDGKNNEMPIIFGPKTNLSAKDYG